MAAQLRVLRSRIRSVKSTSKITRAQELIAAARISGAQQRLAASRPYSGQVTRAVSALLSHHVGLEHALLTEQPHGSRAAVLVLTSDRGFCGAFNQHALKQGDALGEHLRERGIEPQYYLQGRKAVEYFRFRDRSAAAEWSGESGRPGYPLAADISRRLLEAFTLPEERGGVGEVHVVYTEFVSMLTQRLTVRRILPLEVADADADVEAAGAAAPAYDFEPDPATVLDQLLRAYVQGRIWNMLLESAAAEWAARRQAMMSATDNANDLVERLSREANEARQEEITMELSEIVAGANALTSGDRD
ncbi:F0F1 ATP synthase subunit gamma [Actinomadura flavalba]|uniref:F0F1 ATP synthase subunit gamma n=1 Tax=Actinomadura flavalba TaxID=1120938 RepID=UPI0003A91756|nr:F0F1 ATP synthase subunit gamma [Actinomadura flavalba]